MAALRLGEPSPLRGSVGHSGRGLTRHVQVDEYLEQSYLLDPVLEQLVSPLIAALRQLLQRVDADWSLTRVQHVARLLYTISKVRGAKSIGPSRPLLSYRSAR